MLYHPHDVILSHLTLGCNNKDEHHGRQVTEIKGYIIVQYAAWPAGNDSGTTFLLNVPVMNRLIPQSGIWRMIRRMQTTTAQANAQVVYVNHPEQGALVRAQTTLTFP